jgi:hypothetical protein
VNGEVGSGSWGFLGSPLGAGGGERLGLLEAVAVGLDVDDLGAMDEAVDEGVDAGGVGEDPVPLGEGLVGAEQDGLAGVVAAGDDLEEEIGIATVVGQVRSSMARTSRSQGLSMICRSRR